MSVVQEMSRLISQGKPRRALQLGKKNMEADDATSVHFWFQLFLAAKLTQVNTCFVADCLQRAQACVDYSPLIEGDFMRDMAIGALNDRDFQRAEELLDYAERLHDGDKNRQAAIQMVRGRIRLGQGRAEKAIKYHEQASRGLTDPQWKHDNTFHELRAYSKLASRRRGRGRARSIVYLLSRSVMYRDPSKNRRLRASLMCSLGPFGYRVDNLIVHIKNKRR